MISLVPCGKTTVACLGGSAARQTLTTCPSIHPSTPSTGSPGPPGACFCRPPPTHQRGVAWKGILGRKSRPHEYGNELLEPDFISTLGILLTKTTSHDPGAQEPTLPSKRPRAISPSRYACSSAEATRRRIDRWWYREPPISRP